MDPVGGELVRDAIEFAEGGLRRVGLAEAGARQRMDVERLAPHPDPEVRVVEEFPGAGHRGSVSAGA